MKSSYFFLLLPFLFSGSSLAQPPDSLWSRTFGGSGDDYCSSVQQTPEGGYILAGTTGSFGAGGCDFWLVKTDANGNQLWNRTFGGRYDDWCFSVHQTSDGGYILGGFTYSFGAGGDFWLVKTDANGNELWNRTFGGSSLDVCNSLRQTSDGGYILGGTTGSLGAGNIDFLLVKTDAIGNQLWNRTFGGSDYDECSSVQRTSDGGYILAGYTWPEGGYCDFWLVKTDANGNQLWSRTFGGSSLDYCYSVQQISDGGYILGGLTSSFGAGGADFLVVKTDADGNQLWSRTFGGSDDDWCRPVQQTSDGGYILAGVTLSFGAGGADFLLVKTDADGNQLWSRTFGGSSDDYCESVQQTSDGGYILGGRTSSFGAGSFDFWLVKTGPELATEPISVSLPTHYALCPNYPNPFNPFTKIVYALPKMSLISLKVSNLLGQEVASLVDGVQSSGTHTVLFDASGLASGVYLYRLQAADFVQTRKMVLLK